MTRRQLVEGLEQFGVTDAEVVSQVISGEKDPSSAPTARKSDSGQTTTPRPTPLMRVPFTSKVRQDYAHAVKRASLERQLAGQMPNEIQEILEAALGPWLRDNGYIS
jgi:hypothetical protein